LAINSIRKALLARLLTRLAYEFLAKCSGELPWPASGCRGSKGHDLLGTPEPQVQTSEHVELILVKILKKKLKFHQAEEKQLIR